MGPAPPPRAQRPRSAAPAPGAEGLVSIQLDTPDRGTSESDGESSGRRVAPRRLFSTYIFISMGATSVGAGFGGSRHGPLLGPNFIFCVIYTAS